MTGKAATVVIPTTRNMRGFGLLGQLVRDSQEAVVDDGDVLGVLADGPSVGGRPKAQSD